MDCTPPVPKQAEKAEQDGGDDPTDKGSVVLTVVPLSVTDELVGAPPDPPPLIRTFVFRIAELVNAVVLLK
jgi:hypothetical protein